MKNLSDISAPIKSQLNWFTSMASPQVKQTKILLEKLYKDKIDLSDHLKKSEEEKRKIFFSRALAAYYLHSKADITIENSASCITDGYMDNGIDAVYYDEPQNSLYLVQSKMISEGSGEPDTGDMLKFKQGCFDIVEEKFDAKFSSKILKYQQKIKDALGYLDTKLIIAIVYTGKGFAPANKHCINELMEKLNDTTDWAIFDDFNLKSIYASLIASTSNKPIDYDISLTNWGQIEEPYKTYYGQISAFELASIYMKQGKKLFDENIRGFVGVTPINSEILKTVKEEPENFIYFNNGVTMICNSVIPIPGKTIQKTSGGFHCKGMQVINGAQTIGSLGNAIQNFSEQLKKTAVFIRLIPLDECPENFGNRITIASNTQNKIEKRDFVTLDPVQNNLRTELALDGITYHYKRTEEPIVFDEKNCSLEEATVALACLNGDVNYSVIAKREIGKLWEDINSVPYTALFNTQLKGLVMWNAISVYRAVSKQLNLYKTEKIAREKSTCTYGNYFITNLMFCLIAKDKIYNPNIDLEAYLGQNAFKKLVKSVAEESYKQGEINYPTSLIHQLYRNLTKCKDLKEKVLEILSAKNEK